MKRCNYIKDIIELQKIRKILKYCRKHKGKAINCYLKEKYDTDYMWLNNSTNTLEVLIDPTTAICFKHCLNNLAGVGKVKNENVVIRNYEYSIRKCQRRLLKKSLNQLFFILGRSEVDYG